MPSIVFDFEEINKNLMGDDWYAPKREMPKEIFGPFKPEECEQRPCTTAPTPPPPCGQAANQSNQQQAARGLVGGIGVQARDTPDFLKLKNVPPEIKAVPEDPRSAIMHLIQVIDEKIFDESRKLEERMNQLHFLMEQAQTRRARVQYEGAIDDAKAQYHLMIAPMQKQKNWLIEQLTATMELQPVCVAPVDYECEPVRDAEPRTVRTHKRGK